MGMLPKPMIDRLSQLEYREVLSKILYENVDSTGRSIVTSQPSITQHRQKGIYTVYLLFDISIGVHQYTTSPMV